MTGGATHVTGGICVTKGAGHETMMEGTPSVTSIESPSSNKFQDSTPSSQYEDQLDVN